MTLLVFVKHSVVGVSKCKSKFSHALERRTDLLTLLSLGITVSVSKCFWVARLWCEIGRWSDVRVFRPGVWTVRVLRVCVCVQLAAAQVVPCQVWCGSIYLFTASRFSSQMGTEHCVSATFCAMGTFLCQEAGLPWKPKV